MPSSKSHQVTPPTSRTIRDELMRTLGVRSATDLWQRVCDVCALDPWIESGDPERITQIGRYLKSCGGMAAVVGKSALLRLHFLQRMQREELHEAAQKPSLSPADAEALRKSRNARTEEIARLDVLSQDLDTMLEPFLEKVRAATHLPIAAVNILTDDMQHTVASQGLDPMSKSLGGTPKDWSFCQFVVEDRAPLVIDNTAKSRRVRDLPVVKRWKVKCYIGVPLRTKNNQILGALCAVGGGVQFPAFGAQELQAMRMLADEIVSLLEERTLAKSSA